MSFFKKVFSSQDKSKEDSVGLSNGRTLGRYTEVNKKPEQNAYWDKARNEFAQKKYTDSFYSLLMYMRDPQSENVKINPGSDRIDFELIQGSKIIRGFGDNKVFSAEARIARFDKLSVAFLRKLMNMNYVLQYSRFAIKDDVIYLKFDSKAIDASPSKVYYSLRELALKADKMDDTLVGEFDTLHPIDCECIIPVPEHIKEIKYKYLCKWINEVLTKAATYEEDKMAGGISYLLLSLLFRIDALLQPQGNFFDCINKINEIYNAKDNKSTLEKNRLMMEEFRNLLVKPKEEILKDIYDVKLTFGYVPATLHQQFYEFLLEEFKNTEWYYNNRYDDIVTHMYEWMIGYALFYYGLYPATYDFLKIAYMVLQPEFFAELESQPILYNRENGVLNKAAIEKEIARVLKKHIREYPRLSVLTQNINYRSLNEFLYTYLNELTYLDFLQ